MENNYKKNDILIHNGVKFIATDYNSLFNELNERVDELAIELKLKKQMLDDAMVNDRKLTEKINGFIANGVKLNDLIIKVEALNKLVNSNSDVVKKYIGELIRK